MTTIIRATVVKTTCRGCVVASVVSVVRWKSLERGKRALAQQGL